MASDMSDALLTKIGELLAEDTEYPLEGTLLHADVDRNMVGPSIFKDAGNHIMFRWPDMDRLSYVLLDLWEAQDGDARWCEVEYLIKDGRFNVTYIYPEDIDDEVSMLDRRTETVRKYFGDKPILYPPIAEDDGYPDYEV